MRRSRTAVALAAAVTMVAAGAGSAPAAPTVSRPDRSGPGRPRHLGISIFGRRAVLSWTAGRAGRSRIAFYRVERDGRPLSRVRGTRVTVRVLPGAPQRLSVRAVDARGRRSAAATVSTASAQEAPLPPSGLRAVAASDTAVTLAWRAAHAGSAPVVGYRVFRDGVVLGQVAATRTAVPRLSVDEAETFTVAAVDTRGRVSPPSRALTVATGAPSPATGSLHAFVLASASASFEDFEAHYAQIGTIHATYFACNRLTGAVEGGDVPQITSFARLRQVEVFARFDCQDTATLHRVLTEPALRGAWLRTITDQAVAHHYDGVNVDFERGLPADRAAYTSFGTELAARLHAIGKKLAVDVSAKTADDPTHPRSGLYDYPAVAAAADVVFVMAWGIHWTTSTPGPNADMAWLRAVVHYVNTLADGEKYVMGTPLYGLDWPRPAGTGVPARALEWSDVAALSARVGAPAGYDAVAGESHFSYVAPDGVPHEVWASSAAAVLARMRLFRANGYGVGVWRLGRGGPGAVGGPGGGGVGAGRRPALAPAVPGTPAVGDPVLWSRMGP
jgi:spore germination protein YaaH